MRDPNRIEPFLEKVAKVWHKWPDQRFGQLMVNFFGDCKRDPFFPEEDAWEMALDAYLEGRDPSVALDHYYREMSDLRRTGQGHGEYGSRLRSSL